MPPTDDLTPRQREILALIEREVAARGYPPTRAEIAQAFGFRSANAAEEHLRALARKGAIALEAGHRGIRVLRGKGRARSASAAREDAGAAATLPLVGRVSAGAPILAEQHVERQVAIDPSLFASRADYLLRVRGESMRDAGILDGDLVAVRRTPEARDGEMVVARIGDEATVKRLQRRGGQVRLLPAHPDFAPIEVDPAGEPMALEGVVVGVLRTTVGSR
ncbi:MAG: transcriptional repressor LexA [Pseudomonadota bacterium]